MNDNVRYSEARRLAMALAKYYREEIYPLPLDLSFAGLRVRVVVEKITSEDDTKPIGERDAK